MNTYQGELETDYVTRGENAAWDLTAVASGGATAPDFSATKVTVSLDGPTKADGSAGDRFTFRWRPGGTSSSQFSYAAGVLMFDLSATYSAANLYPGKWLLSWSVFEPATNQDEIGAMWLVVIERPNGALPTSDP